MSEVTNFTNNQPQIRGLRSSGLEIGVYAMILSDLGTALTRIFLIKVFNLKHFRLLSINGAAGRIQVSVNCQKMLINLKSLETGAYSSKVEMEGMVRSRA